MKALYLEEFLDDSFLSLNDEESTFFQRYFNKIFSENKDFIDNEYPLDCIYYYNLTLPRIIFNPLRIEDIPVFSFSNFPKKNFLIPETDEFGYINVKI